MSFKSQWSFSLQGPAVGVALAREKGTLLAWDRAHWLALLDRQGKCQARRHFPDGVGPACLSDDGSALAAAGTTGDVWWLAPDLGTRWERRLAHPAVAVALDPFGQYLACADSHGGVQIFDAAGRPVSTAEAPRPLHHLAFVPAAPLLVGAADYGLVAAFELEGKPLWRAGVVAHVGALAVSGDGERVALACFSDGVQFFDRSGQRLDRLNVHEPCRLAALTFDGTRVLVAGLGGNLLLLDRDGRTLGTHALERPATALALDALGRDAFVALGESVTRLAIKEARA
jgi:hypothetical protein